MHMGPGEEKDDKFSQAAESAENQNQSQSQKVAPQQVKSNDRNLDDEDEDLNGSAEFVGAK